MNDPNTKSDPISAPGFSEADRLRGVIEKLYELVTRELAEPFDDNTAGLAEMAMLIEETAGITSPGATPMSDTKSATPDHEQIYMEPACCADPREGRKWCQDDVFDCKDGREATRYVRADLAEVDRAAQAKRIEDLEFDLESFRNACQLNLTTAKRRGAERDVAIQRAEECKAIAKTWQDEYFSINDLLRQIRAALPAERALDMAVDLVDSAADARCADPRVVCGRASKALRAYVAALGKEG